MGLMGIRFWTSIGTMIRRSRALQWIKLFIVSVYPDFDHFLQNVTNERSILGSVHDG